MTRIKQRRLALLFALTILLLLAQPTKAQDGDSNVTHQIEGRLMYKGGRVGGVRVRLVLQSEMRPITETFSRPEGDFKFDQVKEGDYLIETFETEKFEATTTNVSARPPAKGARSVFTVMIDLPLKPPPERAAPGLVMADVDLQVPKTALKHYRTGMKALNSGDPARAVTELKAAIEIYPQYYAARLELGRELGIQKRFQEAAETLQPLGQIAPRRAEPRVEYGKVLLALGRAEEALSELRTALRLQEANWATHLYLGWALLEKDENTATQHFKRAIELDERKAARAHLALARLANARGMRQLAIEHLDAFLALAPNAPDADAARKLAERLRR